MTKEGIRFLAPALAIWLILLVVWVYSSEAVILAFTIVFFVVFLFFIFFFRDPKRDIPSGEDLILSPADGKVICIKPSDSLDFVGGKGTLISVFMSVFNVHVNRAPVSGCVRYFRYNPGKFFPAFKDKASLENEQTELGLENDQGKMILKQIAGIMARRIVCRLKSGDSVKAGERFGMIKFGSRVDLFLPENVKIKVKLNQKVKAGETIIGVFTR
ncbi:MAG: phosphatidylserine decarboxylase family protein [candidate division Zixibacteria bacterium]|nr:phosphatidylserine decarboxylase family protein [candidate division Zixibacteria bacterium]